MRRSSARDVASFPVFLKEELGGPNAEERARIEADYHRRQEKKRQSAERRYWQALNAGSCAICGKPVEDWRLRRPRNLSTCSACDRPVDAMPWRQFGTGLTGISADLCDVLRACTVAIWHLGRADGSPP